MLCRPSISSHPALLPDHDLRVKVKKEKIERAFRSLKGSSTEIINLDSPSPRKSTATSSIVSLPPPKRAKGPPNPDFAGLDHVPDTLEQDLEILVDMQPDDMDITE